MTDRSDLNMVQRFIDASGYLGDHDARATLAAEIRAITDELSTSTADSEDFAVARDLVARAAQVLAGRAHDRPEGPPSEASLIDLDRPHFLVYSPFSGQLNPLAAPISLRIDGDEVVGEVTYGRAYEGPPGCVHGGMIAGGFDEVLGFAQAHSERPGMTGRLTVAYRRPTPLYQPLEYRARITKVDGRKLTVSCTLSVVTSGLLCAEAEGLFIAMLRPPVGGEGAPPPTA